MADEFKVVDDAAVKQRRRGGAIYRAADFAKKNAGRWCEVRRGNPSIGMSVTHWKKTLNRDPSQGTYEVTARKVGESEAAIYLRFTPPPAIQQTG